MLSYPCVERMSVLKTEMSAKLQQSLTANEQFYFRRFSATEIDLFCRYYQLVLKWNELLHLTTITSPSDFAERHLLESAFALQRLLPSIQQVWDIGSGAGIPGIPFAILRPELSINLIEASKKKAIFLKEVKFELGISNLQVFNQRFERISGIGHDTCITSRALDGISRMIPEILNFGQNATQFLLFGTDNLHQITQPYIPPEWKLSLIPIFRSNNRLLLSISRFT